MSYISRDGILNDLQEELELDSIYYNDEMNKGITEGLKLAIKNIKRFPTSDVAPVKHGEWKHNSNGGYVCSECNCWLEDYYGATPEMMKYCFKCGAKMGGERREE